MSQPPPLFRVALWTLLVLTLVAILGLAAIHLIRREAAAALPVLGEVPPFDLVDQDAAAVGREDLAGAPWAADFVFTRCVTSCPVLTARMATVGEGLVEGRDFRRVSISVDPEHDRPEVLRTFKQARRLPPEWWFLTGEPDAVLTLVRDGFHLPVVPDTGDPVDPILHSTRFALVDGEGRIRGFYDGLDPDEVARLDRDLRRLARGW